MRVRWPCQGASMDVYVAGELGKNAQFPNKVCVHTTYRLNNIEGRRLVSSAHYQAYARDQASPSPAGIVVFRTRHRAVGSRLCGA